VTAKEAGIQFTYPRGMKAELTRVRTILVLGYWVLPNNICQYWVVLGTGDIFIGCHTQYQYCSDILMPAVWQLPADDGREIGEEVK